MKKNSFFCILLILCSLGLYSSCSNDDIKTEEQPNQSSLAEQLNKSKLTTIEHNVTTQYPQGMSSYLTVVR